MEMIGCVGGGSRLVKMVTVVIKEMKNGGFGG